MIQPRNNVRGAKAINQNKIELIIKKITKGTLKPREVESEMTRRFDRLTNDNVGMYEELFPLYVAAVQKYDRALVY
jgi:hypothetical protein